MRIIAPLLLVTSLAFADIRECSCDASKPETMTARNCSLCRVAEKQPLEPSIFFLKDNNPHKPHRWLALPRYHIGGRHSLADMTPAQRTALWTAAIRKAKELWGNQWGLAYNGDLHRTQCHMHIHIGKLLPGVENSNYVVVNGPAQIPLPRDGAGLWVHPVGNKLHVHLGEQITETVLLR